jgi:hypothetical protein
MSDQRQVTIAPKTGVMSTGSLLNSQMAYMTYQRANNFVTSTAWPLSGLGIYVPVTVEQPCTFKKMTVLNGVTLNGTLGVGIYDESFNRLTSVAAATQTGASVTQTLDIADITVPPGIYYLMMVVASATATYMCAGSQTALSLRTCGVLEQTGITDTPPNPGVPVAYTRTFVPLLSAHYNSVI